MDTPAIGKMPSHSIIAATSDYKEKATVGALWLKTGDFGNFLSGELKGEYEKDGKVFPGYCIVEDGYINGLLEKIRQFEAKIPKDDFTKALDNAYGQPLDEVVF